tara:strand:+ start:867 stop:1091 length:225 start_codon:yes stop_codon:yes gene_type:complete
MKNQNSRAYNFLKRGCGDRTFDAAAVTAINALNTDTGIDASTPLNDVLDIIRACEIRTRAVGTSSIGLASSTEN